MADILVIDDDEQMLQLVSMMLRRGGHRSSLANTPQQGLAQLAAQKPDLVVLDVMMPGMSGYELCRQIRAHAELADLPILILSARSQEVDRQAGLQSGATDYLSKPVMAQSLLQRIEEILSRRPTASRSPEEGFVLNFFSLRGGVGRTTLAVNVAAALQAQGRRAVCLVELTPSGGQAAFHLRLQTTASWAELPPLPGALDWMQLSANLLDHSSGLRLLAAPAAPQLSTLPAAESVTVWLQLLRQEMDYVVVDLPPLCSPATQAALGCADMVLHVVTPDVISIRLALAGQQFLQTAAPETAVKAFLLNQITTETLLPPEVVERGLRQRVTFQVGCDPQQARALMQGVPLALSNPQSPLALLAHRLAEGIGQRAAGAAV